MPIQNSARGYQCHRCHRQVVICRRCDHGHRYCSDKCAATARADSLKRASRKYRTTRKGRFNNARRQQRFRDRRQQREQKVTHQGSHQKHRHVVLPSKSRWLKKCPKSKQKTQLTVCHVCGCLCPDFFRQDFISRRRFKHS